MKDRNKEEENVEVEVTMISITCSVQQLHDFHIFHFFIFFIFFICLFCCGAHTQGLSLSSTLHIILIFLLHGCLCR